jgi:catechol 2,3-dioxygenase-like lactoylglutathione lyase family enzyme
MTAVRLLVRDVPRALEMYVGRLGFSEVENWGGAFAIVARDGVRLWLSGPQTSAARPLADGAHPEPGAWNRVVVQTPDLAALLASLRHAGVRVRNEPTPGPGGMQALIEDGVGNLVELFQPG